MYRSSCTSTHVRMKHRMSLTLSLPVSLPVPTRTDRQSAVQASLCLSQPRWLLQPSEFCPPLTRFFFLFFSFSVVCRSLSARILRQYGDTPRGMVESAFEFADICTRHHFYNFCFSMKSSNPTVMVHAYRLLAHEMLRRGTLFPLHLGVTEAGEGRCK